MPTFELVPIEQTTIKSNPSRRAWILEEYVGYISQLEPGKAGMLQPSEGKSVAAVRRRVGAAAKLASKDLVIRRAGDEV